MAIHGYPWRFFRGSKIEFLHGFLTIHGYPWLSMAIHGYPWKNKKNQKQIIHGKYDEADQNQPNTVLWATNEASKSLSLANSSLARSFTES